MKLVIEVSDQEIQGLTAAIAAEALKTLAPRLAALEAALSKAFQATQPKTQVVTESQAMAAAAAGSEMIGLAEVKRLTGLSESSIWRHEKDLGTFPRRRQLSARRVAWPRSEVLAWIEGREVA